MSFATVETLSVHLLIFNYTDSGNYAIQQRQIRLQMESIIQVK